MKTVIIAEVGECFNGEMETARRMIHEAKAAGCDIVKFQLLDMNEVALDDPEYDWFAKLDLAPPKLWQLIEWAKMEQIEILFTPVSIRTAKWIKEAGVNTVKIASSFVRKKELIQYINSTFDIVYASTGMASLEEIDELKEMLGNIRDIRIMHCISEYPTGPLLQQRGLKALDEIDAHLNMILILKARYPQIKIGYSDHTNDIFVPVVAAAMGAEIIEKHFTLDRLQPIKMYNEGTGYMGTDHVLSVEPLQLERMVGYIRRIETVQGNMQWERSEGEKILNDFLKGRYKRR